MINGKNFYFKVNDVEIYMKGANQVPLDYYPDRMKDPKVLEWLLKSAERANFNVIRIWGGGMYMDDNFYEMADQMGMLIWQDMMFSSRLYPFLEEDFIQSSKIEVRQQAGRIQHHACIVFWVLNNEGGEIIHWRDDRKSEKAYFKQYNGFYIDIIIPIMKESGIVISQNFMDTSPSSGVESFEPYVRAKVSDASN